MAHPNEEIIRRSYDAFNNADLDALRAMFADDCVFHAPGRSPISGDYRGVDEVMGFLGKVVELSGGTFKGEMHDALGNDEHGIGLQVSRGQREGKTLDSKDTLVAHIRDGKFTEIWFHTEDQYAADEFWS